MRSVALTIGTLLLASSAFAPAIAQDQPKPSVSAQQQQSKPDNQAIGKDWKANPSATVGNATGKSPDSANKDDSKKLDRDWRVKEGSDKK